MYLIRALLKDICRVPLPHFCSEVYCRRPGVFQYPNSGDVGN
jgi:hypothetical protein